MKQKNLKLKKSQKILSDIKILKNKGEINGCGGKGSFIKPPYSAFFVASCEIHDYNYYIGGQEHDRIRADEGFLKYMIYDINSRKEGIERVYFVLWAYMYFYAVRTFGKKYFNYK